MPVARPWTKASSGPGLTLHSERLGASLASEEITVVYYHRHINCPNVRNRPPAYKLYTEPLERARPLTCVNSGFGNHEQIVASREKASPFFICSFFVIPEHQRSSRSILPCSFIVSNRLLLVAVQLPNSVFLLPIFQSLTAFRGRKFAR